MTRRTEVVVVGGSHHGETFFADKRKRKIKTKAKSGPMIELYEQLRTRDGTPLFVYRTEDKTGTTIGKPMTVI
jgi:hypothetical protein